MERKSEEETREKSRKKKEEARDKKQREEGRGQRQKDGKKTTKEDHGCILYLYQKEAERKSQKEVSVMATRYDIHLPFDSTDAFPDMIRNLMLYFDTVTVFLPMWERGKPFYDEDIWGKIYLDAFSLSRKGYFHFFYTGVYNELSFSHKITDLSLEGLPSEPDFSLLHIPVPRDKDLPEDASLEDLINQDHLDHLARGQYYRMFHSSFLLSSIYKRKNAASAWYDLPTLYNASAQAYGLDSSHAYTAKPIVLPYFTGLAFDRGTPSLAFLRQDHEEERREWLSSLSKAFSGFYPEETDRLEDFIEEVVNPQIGRFHEAARSGKIGYLNALRQELGKPQKRMTLTVSFFAGRTEHIQAAVTKKDLSRGFKLGYVEDVGKHRKNPIFLKIETEDEKPE